MLGLKNNIKEIKVVKMCILINKPGVKYNKFCHFKTHDWEKWITKIWEADIF